MGRPRKHVSNAARQAAYRGRKRPPVVESLIETAMQIAREGRPAQKGCQAYAPHGTKCKLCGKSH